MRAHPRRVTAALAVALLVSLVACSSKSSQPKLTAPTARNAQVTVNDVNGAKASPECAAKVKTLRVTTFGAIGDAAKNAQRFMQQQHPGLNVELSSSAQSYEEVVSQIGADKAAGRQTDVAVAGFDTLPIFINQLGAQELDPRLLRASYDQRYLPLAKVNGKLYGIPEQVSLPVLMYNENLLKKAGVDPATLKDTDGVQRAVDALKKAGVQTPIDIPTDFSYWAMDTLAHSKGSGVQGTDGKPAFTSPNVQQAMNVLSGFGHSGPQSANPTTEGLLNFGLQRSAMVMATVAAVAPVKNALAQRPKQAFPLGVIPFPTLPGGTLAPVAGGNALAVLATDKCQKEMATEMVVALLSPDLLAAGIQAASYLPIDSKTEQILTDFYNQNPDLKSLNNLADSLKPPPYWNGSRGGEVPTAARDTAIAVNRGQDPGQALSDLQAKAQDLTK